MSTVYPSLTEFNKFKVDSNYILLDSIEDLMNFELSDLHMDQIFNVKSYHKGLNRGGGVFYWDKYSSEEPNGGTIIESNVYTGRFIRYIEFLDPYCFGAKGDNDPEDTPILQKFIYYLAENNVPRSSIEGNFTLKDTLHIGNPNGGVMATKMITLDVTFYSDMDINEQKPALWFENSRYSSWPGYLEITGNGGTWGTSRTLYDGMAFGQNSGGQHFDVVYISLAYRWALNRNVPTNGGGFTSFNIFTASSCGSRHYPTDENPYPFKPIDHVAIPDYTKHYGGASVLTFEDPLPIGIVPKSCFVCSNPSSSDRYLFSVEEVDYENNTLTVWPRLDWYYNNTQDFRLAYGGGIWHKGQGSYFSNYKNLNIGGCPIGILDQAFYASEYGIVHVKSGIAPVILGRSYSTPLFGGSMRTLYVEGNSLFRGIINFTYQNHFVLLDSSIAYAKDTFRLLGNFINGPAKRVANGIPMLSEHKFLPYGSYANNEGKIRTVVSVTQKGFSHSHAFTRDPDSNYKTIKLLTPSQSEIQSGATSLSFILTRQDGTPMVNGDCEIYSGDDDVTVMGVSNYVITINTVVYIHCFYDIDRKDWKIYIFEGLFQPSN